MHPAFGGPVAEGWEVKPLSDRQYRSLARFRHELRVFLRFSELSAREVGLTPAQHQLLLAVRGWDGPGAPSVGALADFLQAKPHSTLELVRRAEEGGLLHTEPDPEDRRRQLVGLTQLGEERLAALSVLHRDELRRFRAEMHEILGELD